MIKRLFCVLFVLLLFCLPLSGCGHTQDTLPDTLVFADMDLSGVRSVQLHSGMTGEKVLLTDPANLAPILDGVQALSGKDPISSRGYYGWTYSFAFYETDSPSAEDVPVLSFGIFDNKVRGETISYLTHGVYETVHGVSYSAMYVTDPAAVLALEDLCAAHFPPLP